MIQRFRKYMSPFVFVTLAYLAAVLLVKPWADIAINDDWDFFLHVRYFSEGIFMKNSLIDSVFVLQGFLGVFWTKIFGLSFVSLRVLTVLMTLGLLLGVAKLLSYLKVNKNIQTLTLLTFVFNPIVFSSSLTFMTEIYFLVFFIWSLYYFFRFLDHDDNRSFFIAVLFCAGSMLIRQFGLVLFITYTAVFVIRSIGAKRLESKRAVFLIVSFLAAVSLALLWPQYSDTDITTLRKIQGLFVVKKSFVYQIKRSFYVANYVGFFLLPLSLGFIFSRRRKILVVTAVLAMIFFSNVYEVDVFPIGNVFYLEGLYAKNDFIHDITLFDNIPFKIFVSLMVTFSFVSLLIFVAQKVAKVGFVGMLQYLKNYRNLTFLILSSGMFFSIILANGFFDRYFINFVVVIVIWVGVGLKNLKTRALVVSYVGVILLATVSIFLNYEYFASNKLKWQFARVLQEERDLSTEVYVNGAFTRYVHNAKYAHPENVTRPVPVGIKWMCFAQRYSVTNENKLNKLLERFENSRTINKYFVNPEIPDSKGTTRIRAISNNLGKLIYNQEYFSPMFNLIGKRAFIGAYCLPPK